MLQEEGDQTTVTFWLFELSFRLEVEVGMKS